MATELPTTNGHTAQDGENNFAVKAGLARMLKGGVIMDVVNAEQVRSTPSLPDSKTRGSRAWSLRSMTM
jgi:hypothetical protein